MKRIIPFLKGLRRVLLPKWGELYENGQQHAKMLVDSGMSPEEAYESFFESNNDPYDIGGRDYLYIKHGVGSLQMYPGSPVSRNRINYFYFCLLGVAILAVAFISTGAEAKEVTVEGVLRNTGSGWTFLNDAGHAPVGIQTVWNDSSAILVDYNFHAEKVRTFVVTGDEMYAGRRSIVCGANVGLDYAIIECSSNGSSVNPATMTELWGNLFIYGVFDDGQ